MNRRSFLGKAGLGTAGFASLQETGVGKGLGAGFLQTSFSGGDAAGTQYGIQHCVSEWSYSSGKAYADPFNDLELDVVFTDPQGKEHRMPAFWAGERMWRIRFSPLSTGRYTYRTVATDTSNPDLHGREGALEVSEYQGTNPLRVHGAPRVAPDRRHFELEDGTPFLWL